MCVCGAGVHAVGLHVYVRFVLVCVCAESEGMTPPQKTKQSSHSMQKKERLHVFLDSSRATKNRQNV